MTTTVPAITFLPEELVLGAALVVFLTDVLGVRRLEALGAVAVAGITGALGLVVADLGFAPLAFARTLDPSQVDGPLAPSILFGFTGLGLLFQAIFLTSALLVGLASLSRASDERGGSVFYGLLLLATLGMLLVAIAEDLIFLLLAIEVTSIATYLMVGYSRRDPRGLEAAMKFFIIGALSAALSFFGASLLFGAYGSTSFAVLGRGLSGPGAPALVDLGYGFLVVGLAFKVTLVPFHAWAVDVYDGAPTDVSAFLAGGTKKIGLFAFFLVFLVPVSLGLKGCLSACGSASSGLAIGGSIRLSLGILAVLTMTVGNLLALLQGEMKRMLAYSSISQAGYMLIGVTVATPPAVAGATLQIFAHVLLKAGAFLVVAAVAGLGVGPLINDWRGVGVRRPLLGASFAVMLLGLAGIPLTIGFVSKFILFSSAIQAEGGFVWLAIAGLLNSALSVFYYARVLKAMYLERAEPISVPLPGTTAIVGGSDPPSLAFDGVGWGRAAAIAIATGAIVVLGIDPQPVLQATQSAATHFLGLGA